MNKEISEKYILLTVNTYLSVKEKLKTYGSFDDYNDRQLFIRLTELALTGMFTNEPGFFTQQLRTQVAKKIEEAKRDGIL